MPEPEKIASLHVQKPQLGVQYVENIGYSGTQLDPAVRQDIDALHTFLVGRQDLVYVGSGEDKIIFF